MFATNVFSITIISAPSIVTATPLPDGERGISYSRNITASGGQTPYIWSVVGLPAGLALTQAGVISGIPAATGNYSANVTLTDSFGTPAGTVSKILTIRIFNAIQITTTSLAEALQGKAYSQNLLASGGNSSYSWNTTGLPAGLICSTSGNISGIPTASGNFTVNIGVGDSISGNNSANITLTLKVYLPYDANGNGVVDMGDVIKVERIILGYDTATPAADANGDGRVDAGDIVKIERVILGIDR